MSFRTTYPVNRAALESTARWYGFAQFRFYR